MLLYTLINNFYEPMLRELKEQFPEAWNHIMEMSNKGMWTIEQTMRDLYQDPEMQEIIQREMELWSQRGKKQDA